MQPDAYRNGAGRTGHSNNAPVDHMNFYAFVVKIVNNMLQNPIFYFVTGFIILVFTARKFLRSKRR